MEKKRLKEKTLQNILQDFKKYHKLRVLKNNSSNSHSLSFSGLKHLEIYRGVLSSWYNLKSTGFVSLYGQNCSCPPFSLPCSILDNVRIYITYWLPYMRTSTAFSNLFHSPSCRLQRVSTIERDRLSMKGLDNRNKIWG